MILLGLSLGVILNRVRVAMEFHEADYNDELLPPGGADHERAQRNFGEIMFALYHKALFEDFNRLDDLAKASKRKMQNAGFCSVFFGLIALILAAVDMSLIAPAVDVMAHCESCSKSFWLNGLSQEAAEMLVKAVALIAATLGVISFVTGYLGGSIGVRKRRWLMLRATCELFRQWRWNHYLANLDVIIDAIGDDEREKAYAKDMETAAKRFFQECKIELNPLMDGLLSGELKVGTFDELINVPVAERPKTLSNAKREIWLPVLLDAFDAIRTRSQLWYAHYILQPHGAFRTHALRQISVLHRAEEILIVLVLVLHGLIVCGVLFDVPVLKGAAVHFLAVSSALTTLAIMCIERGLRPAAHIMRVKTYFNEVAAIRTRFKETPNSEVKRKIASEVGDAALEELRDFLQESNRARFVI